MSREISDEEREDAILEGKMEQKRRRDQIRHASDPWNCDCAICNDVPTDDDEATDKTDEDEPEATTEPQVIAERGEIPDPYDPENRPGLWGSMFANAKTEEPK